jgi:MoxR-like ATPase
VSFTNLLLADEINRAPAKVQSALYGRFEFYARSLAAGEATQMTIHSDTTLTD